MRVETAGLKPEIMGSNGAFCHVGGRESSAGRACCLLLGGQARREVKHASKNAGLAA